MARPRASHATRRRGAATPQVDDSALAHALQRARFAAFLGLPPEPTGADLPEDLQTLLSEAATVYASAISDDTRADYARRWRRFEAWCARRDLVALPADPGTVMLFMTEHARAGQSIALATVRGWLAAINRVHVEAGLPPPSDDPGMGLFLRGLSRMLPTQPKAAQVQALRIADLRAICRHIEQNRVDPTAVRDRCLLLLHAHGLDSTQIAHLRWTDVTIRPEHLRLTLRGPKGSPPTIVTIKPSTDPDQPSAAAATSDWSDVGGQPDGPCFIRVTSTLISKQAPLRASDIERILRSRLDSLGHNGPATPPQAARLLSGPPSADLRDRAMLLVGFAGAFRRIEVVRLRWGDIRQTPDGIIVRVRRSKTDPLGHGVEIGIPFGRSELTCPVRAVQAWRERVETHHGEPVDPETPCFVRVGHAGRIGTQALTPEALCEMIARRARRAGLTGKWGGRSLRAGFISTAADLDIPLELIARQSRHATLDNLVRYIRADDPFRRNASARVGM